MEKMDYILYIVPAAFLLDLLIGDPVYSWHPIRIIGNKLILPVEKILMDFGADGCFGGFVLLIFSISVSTFSVIALNSFLKGYLLSYFVFNTYLVYSCFATKDLGVHVRRVMKFLEVGDITAAKKELSMVVGRETNKLNYGEIATACVETLAENFSDGIVAPIFYAFIGGAPLVVLYKTVNTLDSMVGYKNERYMKFGFFSAKFDDLLNWVPARLSPFFIFLTGNKYSDNFSDAWNVFLKDRLTHSSPNSAYPEAAMAGVLNLRLGGPNYYHGELVCKKYINRTGEIADAKAVSYAWKITAMAARGAFVFFFICRLFF